jgi:hypothetical protein
VDHVGCHGALHDVEAVDVQQTKTSHNLCMREKSWIFCLRETETQCDTWPVW